MARDRNHRHRRRKRDTRRRTTTSRGTNNHNHNNHNNHTNNVNPATFLAQAESFWNDQSQGTLTLCGKKYVSFHTYRILAAWIPGSGGGEALIMFLTSWINLVVSALTLIIPDNYTGPPAVMVYMLGTMNLLVAQTCMHIWYGAMHYYWPGLIFFVWRNPILDKVTEPYYQSSRGGCGAGSILEPHFTGIFHNRSVDSNLYDMRQMRRRMSALYHYPNCATPPLHSQTWQTLVVLPFLMPNIITMNLSNLFLIPICLCIFPDAGPEAALSREERQERQEWYDMKMERERQRREGTLAPQDEISGYEPHDLLTPTLEEKEEFVVALSMSLATFMASMFWPMLFWYGYGRSDAYQLIAGFSIYAQEELFLSLFFSKSAPEFVLAYFTAIVGDIIGIGMDLPLPEIEVPDPELTALPSRTGNDSDIDDHNDSDNDNSSDDSDNDSDIESRRRRRRRRRRNSSSNSSSCSGGNSSTTTR